MITWLGILFTFLWSTAAVVTKFGIASSPPLTLATIRFLLAGAILVVVIYLFLYRQKIPFPKGREWFHITVIGILNTTIYLGAAFWALEHVSAGFFNLIVTTNPFFVAFLSTVLLGRRLMKREWWGMAIAAAGIWIATIPSIASGYATTAGIIVLLIGMLSMAIGSVYYKKIDLQLPGSVINTWQVLIGGVLLIPMMIVLEGGRDVTWDLSFFMTLSYLVVVISIATMLLWFYLLKIDAVKANNWLFLTPVFGYLLASILLGERVTPFDMLAAAFVIIGLYLTGNIHLPKGKKMDRGIPQEM